MRENVPPIAESKRANCLDEKILEFSSDLFKIPQFGYAISLVLNLLYIYLWYKKTTIFSLIIRVFLFYLILKLIQKQIFEVKINQKLDEEGIKNNLFELHSQLTEFFNKIISFEDILTSVKLLVKLYVCKNILNLINDKFLLWVLLNIVVLYSQIEKICPHFIFKARMAVKQTIEGTIGILECFIPRYEEPENKK